VRKVKEGETTNDCSGSSTQSLTTSWAQIHPKAMSLILTTAHEIDCWFAAPTDEALKLQRPLPNGILQIVARGEPTDGASDPN